MVPARRILHSYAPASAFDPLTRPMLAKLGYQILQLDELNWMPPVLSGREADLAIVCEATLGQKITPPELPLVLLTRDATERVEEPRVFGVVPIPAGVHDLYRVLQCALEATPRSSPRVSTRLPARVRAAESEWDGTIVSISESGCLIASHAALPLRSSVELKFSLPRVGEVSTGAEVSYALRSSVGLVFHPLHLALRRSLSQYLIQELSA